MRSSVSNTNGDPALDGATPDVATSLQHVVLTFDPAVGRKLYVNGAVSAQETAPATLAWTNDQLFVIGNEVTNDRLWKGTFELVVQVNGKVRDRFEVDTGTAEDALVERARASARVQAHLDGAQIRKTIVVPGKLVNFVV